MRKIIITMMAIAFSLSAFSADITLLGEWEKPSKPSVYAWCVGGMVITTLRPYTVRGNSLGFYQILNEDSKPMTCKEYKELGDNYEKTNTNS